MKDIELPPLPESCQNGNQTTDYFGKLFEYTRQDMRSYARAAVEADRAQRVPDGFRMVSVEMLTRWRDAFAEELGAWDIDPPIHHVQVGFDETSALIASTPAQPAQKPTTSVPWMTARRAAYFMERFLHEEKMLGPNEQDALRFTIEALEAMATTHQAPPQPVERNPITRNCPECLYSDSWGIADKAFCSQCRPTETGNGSLFHPLNERHHGIRE